MFVATFHIAPTLGQACQLAAWATLLTHFPPDPIDEHQYGVGLLTVQRKLLAHRLPYRVLAEGDGVWWTLDHTRHLLWLHRPEQIVPCLLDGIAPATLVALYINQIVEVVDGRGAYACHYRGQLADIHTGGADFSVWLDPRASAGIGPVSHRRPLVRFDSGEIDNVDLSGPVPVVHLNRPARIVARLNPHDLPPLAAAATELF